MSSLFHSFFTFATLATFSFVNAYPQNITTSSSSSNIHTVIPEYAERFISQLPEADWPVLARNALPASELPIINLPYGQYRATKYVAANDVSHCNVSMP
jgi:hypothetical protein